MKRLALITVSVLAGLYLLYMAAYYVTSEPTLYCNRCHFIRPYVSSWKQASHRDVKCLFCHGERGFLGKIESKVRGLNYVYMWATGQYSGVTSAVIYEQNCIACHMGDVRQYPDAIRIDNEGMDHYEAIQQDRSCLECHADTGHQTDILINREFTKLWK